MIPSMTLRAFFRPTPFTLLGSLVITGIAAFLTIQMILSALNGAGNAYEYPIAVQAVLLAILWPWALLMRFGGMQNTQLMVILGFLGSLVWMYAILCLKRWLFAFVRRAWLKKRNI